MNFDKEFQKQNQYKYSIIITGISLFLGILLQYFTGTIPRQWFSFPNNIILGLIFILVNTAVFFLFKQKNFVNLHSSVPFAIVSSATLGVLTIGLGSINLDSSNTATPQYLLRLGLDNITRTWYFALIFLLVLTNLWLAILKRALVFQKKNVTFLLNHFGLWLTLFAGVLGQGDLMRLTMDLHKDQTEWRAKDSEGHVHELPIALELKNFNIDIYPNKVYIIDKEGTPLPENKPQSFLLENNGTSMTMLDWKITLHEYLSNAVPVNENEFAANPMWGATNAAKITVQNIKNNTTTTEWIAAGNFQFPAKTIMLDSNHIVVMAPAEARKFESEVLVYQKGKEEIREEKIEVNNPITVDGWKIYQVSYDERFGRWSDLSVVELILDPWLPVVYIGIFILMAGSVAFLFKSRK